VTAGSSSRMPPLTGGNSSFRSSVGCSLVATDVFSPPIRYKMEADTRSSSLVHLGGVSSVRSCGHINNVWDLLQWMEVDWCASPGEQALAASGSFCCFGVAYVFPKLLRVLYVKRGCTVICFNIIPFLSQKKGR
jgi:hypothetical protein